MARFAPQRPEPGATSLALRRGWPYPAVMHRNVLPGARVHGAIVETMASFKASVVADVEAAIASHDVVVVGMDQNPFPRRARKLLDEKGIAYHYVSWGSYMSKWRERLALKLWSGWPTFPMIFVKGVLIGGFQDLQRLVESGEFEQMLASPRGD